MVVNIFKRGIFSMPLKKSEAQSDDLFLSEFYEGISASESPTEILLEDLLPRRSTQGRWIKLLPT